MHSHQRDFLSIPSTIFSISGSAKASYIHHTDSVGDLNQMQAK